MDAADLAAVQARLEASLPYDDEASTITLVVGLTPAQVLEAFGGDLAATPVSREETWEDDYDGGPTVAIVEVPGGVVAVELNGYEGSRAEALRRASAAGRAASVYWNANAHTRLSLAEAGVVRYDEEIWEDAEIEDAALRPFFDGTDFAFETWLASAVTVVERFTGVRIDRPMPPDPLMLHRLAPRLAERVRREPTPEEEAEEYRYFHQQHSFARSFGEVGARQIIEGVGAAPVAVRRKVAAYAVRRALRAAGLENHADVQSTLAGLDTAPTLEPAAELLIRRGKHVGYNVATPPSACALHALEEAVSGDSAMAALEALRWALAAIDGAAQAQDRPIGRRLSDWQRRLLPTIRGQYYMCRDRRAFLEEVFARLGVVPGPGALPEMPAPPAEAPAGSWERISAWPYVPWDQAFTVWTGAEALVFGQPSERRAGRLVLPFEVGLAAGAYDPARDRWRPVTPPPFPLYLATLATCGWVVYASVLRTDRASAWELWAYGIAGDSWRQLPSPPVQFRQSPQLTAAGGSLVLWAGSAFDDQPEVWLYDPVAERWRGAPPTPWDGCELQQVLGLADGRIVRLDVPAAATEPPGGFGSLSMVGVAYAADAGLEGELALVGHEFAAVAAGFGRMPTDTPDEDEGGDAEDYDEDPEDYVDCIPYDPNDDGDDPENPSYTWRVAVLDPGADRWRTSRRPPSSRRGRLSPPGPSSAVTSCARGAGAGRRT